MKSNQYSLIMTNNSNIIMIVIVLRHRIIKTAQAPMQPQI